MGTVPEYVQSNAGSPVSPGAMMADKPQLKLLCFKERFFPSNMKSMSLQILLVCATGALEIHSEVQTVT